MRPSLCWSVVEPQRRSLLTKSAQPFQQDFARQMTTPSPSPESSGALRAVRDFEASLPAPPPLPRRTMFQHPVAKASGVAAIVITLAGMLVPVWQTWLDQGHQLRSLEGELRSLERKVTALRVENTELRKQLRSANRELKRLKAK